TRTIYNRCVKICFRRVNKPRERVNQKRLRALLITDGPDHLFKGAKKEAFLKVPAAIRDDVISEFITAYGIQMDLLKEGKIKQFVMHYRSKNRMLQQSISLQT